MHTEARKLFIIEAVLKTNDDAILQAMEIIVNNDSIINASNSLKSRFSDLTGTITPEEAQTMKQAIEENFEQINLDDWK